MSAPTVAAVMLCSPGRERYQAQAIACFTAQTYPVRLRNLFVLPAVSGVSIGEMRNRINDMAGVVDISTGLLHKPEIIVHWDDDDWSHPNRIAEQVAALELALGWDGEYGCVGYNSMLFWDSRGGGEAWMYSNPNPRYALGTSLCYRRETWERTPFPDLHHGEDTEWIRQVGCVGTYSAEDPALGARMIARIHAGNSSSAYDQIEMWRHNAMGPQERQWTRVPHWDQQCRKVMEEGLYEAESGML